LYNTPCYAGFKDYLVTRGFTVYPYEFDCFGAKHPLVDIAGKIGSFYWAFEYKSETDSISRGVEQVKSYSDWFDYVVLVSERVLNHAKSDFFWDLKSAGAGVWTYFPDSSKCVEQVNPQLQCPDRNNHRSVGSRFRALSQKRRKWSRAISLLDLGQADLRNFI
jgi:hypothetical protein